METGEGIPGTGLPSLDRVIQGVIPGDNIVWQIDLIGDYAVLVESFCDNALRNGRKLVYFRFARHPALLPADCGAEIHVLSPEVGFETFTAQIHKVIGNSGRGTYYVFDCLSDLAADWYSDMMLRNFFMVTCPYLYELETVTYFALLRGFHSFDAVSAIRETTQLLLDIFRHGDKLYVHPLKVYQRHSPTMYLPHVWERDDFLPVAESSVLADVLGGKSVGMLLARAILCRTDGKWRSKLERHDSFYIGSDVFYTYLVRNGCWGVRRGHPGPAAFLARA